VEFLGRFDLKQTYALINAANYLDIVSLLNLVASEVARVVMGKNPSDFPKLLAVV
jgi:hypothetical protein